MKGIDMTDQLISVNPAVMNGKPCIRGTRIPVYMVLDLLAAGIKPESIISKEYYPELSIDAVQACIGYANQLVKNEEVHLFEEFVH